MDVTVRARLTGRAAPTTVTAGQQVTISGVLSPAHPGTAVVVQARLGGRWRTIGQPASNSSGAYSVTTRPAVVGTQDYRATAEAASSNFHNAIHDTVGDGTANFGSYQNGTVTTFCPLYDSTTQNSNPGSRGGDFQHEGWHAWMEKYNWNNGSAGGHRPGPTGNCTFSACDYFYFHGISKYVFGAMWENDGTANRFHSPNQVQVEYLCDIADQSKSWVPASVRLAAKTDADTRAAARFINGPGYTCGSARPW